jgi:transcription termination factor Rho
VNADASGTDATQLLLDRLSRTQSNAEFLATLKDAV